MESQLNNGIKDVCKFLEEGKPAQAKKAISEVLEYELDNKEINFALWCCEFWIDFIDQLPELDLFEQGEGLFSRWKSFLLAVQHKSQAFDRIMYSVQTGVFTLALNSFNIIVKERNYFQKAEIFKKTGICLKKLGKYETALNCLTEANGMSPSSAAILAEMADCYALCGEEKRAKVLFREAFFIDAQKIDIDFLDSELICCLIRQVKEKGYVGAALQEWIPVYGVLLGVLNVKRELRSQEVGKLKQEIYAMESQKKNSTDEYNDIFVPKMINMYFWLIDHYMMTNVSGKKISDIMLKIKILDRNIYEMYDK